MMPTTEAKMNRVSLPLPDTSNIPHIKLHNPVAGFIENHLDESDHPAFAKAGTVYVPSLDQWKSTNGEAYVLK